MLRGIWEWLPLSGLVSFLFRRILLPALEPWPRPVFHVPQHPFEALRLLRCLYPPISRCQEVTQPSQAGEGRSSLLSPAVPTVALRGVGLAGQAFLSRFFVHFCQVEDGTQGLTHARQVLYHGATAPALLASFKIRLREKARSGQTAGVETSFQAGGAPSGRNVPSSESARPSVPVRWQVAAAGGGAPAVERARPRPRKAQMVFFLSVSALAPFCCDE